MTDPANLVNTIKFAKHHLCILVYRKTLSFSHNNILSASSPLFAPDIAILGSPELQCVLKEH